MPAKIEDEHAEKLRQYRKGYREGFKEGFKAALSDVKEGYESHVGEGGATPRWPPSWWPFK
jgi:flagellar biosynthesis/type III secretory pathway protein FliH